MSCFNLQVANYADFQAVVNDILSSTTGRIYYHTYASGDFQCVFVADDISRVVFLGPNPAITIPASFSTDYPSAILITNTTFWAFPQMGSSTWTFFGT